MAPAWLSWQLEHGILDLSVVGSSPILGIEIVKNKILKKLCIKGFLIGLHFYSFAKCLPKSISSLLQLLRDSSYRLFCHQLTLSISKENSSSSFSMSSFSSPPSPSFLNYLEENSNLSSLQGEKLESLLINISPSSADSITLSRSFSFF